MYGISLRLKELRKNSNLTQEQMAKYLDVDQSLITKIENGTRVLSVTMIDKLCSLFGCTEDYLLGHSEKYISLNFAFRVDTKWISTFDKLPEEGKVVMAIINQEGNHLYSSFVKLIDSKKGNWCTVNFSTLDGPTMKKEELSYINCL